MNETEFLQITDNLFDHIERTLDAAELDMDSNRNGNVLEIEFDQGEKLVINRHVANQEVWLAARSGGFHYRLQDGRWQSTRDDTDLLAQLSALVARITGSGLSF